DIRMANARPEGSECQILSTSTSVSSFPKFWPRDAVVSSTRFTVTFQAQRQSEESGFTIEELVAQIQRCALPARLSTIHQAWNGSDIVSRKRRFELYPEVLDRYDFQLELLPEGLVRSCLL